MAKDPLEGAIYGGGFEYLGYSDQGGNPSGVQIMVTDGYAYIGQPHGMTVLDVRDPRDMKVVRQDPAHGIRTQAIHLQVHGDLLLVAEELDNSLFHGPFPEILRSKYADLDYSAGVRVYDISDRTSPREIGFMPVEGIGFHRLWYDGGNYAYGSVYLDDYTDCVFMAMDVSDPTKPFEVGRWWIPGMWIAGGEVPSWTSRYALHHPVVKDEIAYCGWRDGGMVILDVHDPSNPTLISHTNWSPPFGGGTHNCLALHDRDLVVVTDEAHEDNCADQVKYTWLFDIREPARPVSISTLPTPTERDFCSEPGHFGPHNVYENRIGAWQSSSTVFVTYQNAGLRAFDISDKYAPKQTAYFVASKPERADAKPGEDPYEPLHAADVFVTTDGICFATDTARGLFSFQYTG